MESFNFDERRKCCKFSLSHRLQQQEEKFKATGGKLENYKLEDIFTASNGNFDIQQKHINGIGDYVISSGVQNLGIIGKTDVEAKIFPSNTITVDMFGNVYYRDFPYKMVTHARVFSLSFKNKQVSSRAALFISSCMQFLNQKFSYSDMASWEKIKKQGISIYLPTKNNQIDFDYMEERIRVLEEERIRVLEAYLKVTGLDKYILTKEEQEAYDTIHNGGGRFRLYTIGSLFDIATGRDFIIGNTKNGNIPLVSHTNTNNGIVAYVEQVSSRRIFKANSTIALADRGVFYATTQLKDFHIGTRVKALTFKDGEKSEENRLFVTTAINKLQLFFTEYLTNATDKLPNLNIYLPVNQNDEIDYELMETYIRAIEKKVIKNVIDWKDAIIEKTKEIIA